MLYHVRSITLIPVGAGSPIIFAKNGQSHKPAPAMYYGRSIGHDMIGIRLSFFPTKLGHNSVVSLQNHYGIFVEKRPRLSPARDYASFDKKRFQPPIIMLK